MARRLLLRNLKTVFEKAKTSEYWIQLKRLPSILRYLVGVFLMAFGLLGMLTPIPAGIVFFLIGLALIIGLHRVRIGVMRFVHWTRLHILYGKLYIWWHNRNQSR